MGEEERQRFERAVAAIDAANAADPTRVTVGGRDRPKELVHAELVTAWVRRLRPDADEALLLAARAHHLRRWVVPRSAFPEGRAGYLRWRRELHERHALEAGELLVASGYDPETVGRVQELVRKRNLATDPDVQTLEDALCLVFLETQFADLSARTEPDRMVEILRRSLAKMSEEGRRQAMGLAHDLPEEHLGLLQRALS